MRLANWENKMDTGGALEVLFKPLPPTLAEVSSTYKTLVEKKAELQAELVNLGRELLSLPKKIDADGGFGVTAESISAANLARARASELLGEKPVEDVNLRARYVEVNRKIGDVKTALEMLDLRLGEERMAASSVLCEKISNDHRKLVVEMCKRAVDLYEATARYDEFVGALNADGVAWSKLRPMQPQFCGAPDDRNGGLAMYLREAATYGFIGLGEIPERIR